jgi:PAS domain S-box-containing protein
VKTWRLPWILAALGGGSLVVSGGVLAGLVWLDRGWDLTEGRALVITGVLLGGILVAVSVGSAVIAHRSISRRILDLTARAKSVTSGAAPAPLAPVSGDDELAELARSFNQMLDALGQHAAALSGSEERLRMALDAARMGTWTWDILENRVTWSERIEAIFGLAPGSFSGTYDGYLRLVPESERVKIEEAIAAVLAAPDTDYRIEHGIVWPDGSRRVLETRGRAFCDVSGKPVRMAGTVVDVTEQRRSSEAWQALHRATTAVGEAFFQALVRELSQLFSADYAFVGEILPGGRRVRTRALWAKGGAADNIEYDLAGTPCANALAQGVCVLDEGLQAAYPDDHLLVTLGVQAYYGVLLRASNGQPVGLLVVLHSRPLAEVATVRSLITVFAGRAGSELERLKAEAELRQAQKIESIGQLAGGVAHDFNNSLQAIMGFTTLARDSSIGAVERDECLREILTASARAVDITRQLLLFSRQQPLQMVDVELGELLARLTKFVRRLLPETVDLRIEPAPGPVWITADKTQVEQVLINLCVNSRDALSEHRGTIVIRHGAVEFEPESAKEHPWSRPGRFAELVVRDDGCGMDAATLARIFEPFFTTKGRERGTGLGLSVVHGIVQRHEGFVHVTSHPGQGTEFRVYFPLGKEPGEATAAIAAAGKTRGAGTILVAEDEPGVRSMVERLLLRSGYQVVLACDGEDALRVFEKRRDEIDLLLLDVVMPRATGFEVYRRVSAERPDIPVIFCSGYNEELSTRKVGLPGHARLLPKPYALDDLLAAIREAIDGR